MDSSDLTRLLNKIPYYTVLLLVLFTDIAVFHVRFDVVFLHRTMAAKSRGIQWNDFGSWIKRRDEL